MANVQKHQILTFKFRLKDSHSSGLNRQARSVNVVWNYCNETQKKAASDGRKWLSGFDLQRLTSGSSAELDLHAHTIQRVCSRYFETRRTRRKPWLRWRGRKSLGWVPFNTGHVTFDGRCFKFRGTQYRVMHARSSLQAGTKIRAGSFNQDANGRWYINVAVEMECRSSAPTAHVGIDLGLKSFASLSTGESIAAPRFYRKSEIVLATIQRAHKTPRRIRNIHRKTANRRKDFLHKLSTEITKNFGLIVVGDVNPKRIAKSRFAKSSLDAGWAIFKNMLSYKAIRHGGRMIEVSEQYTSQVCSNCGSMPNSRPRGIADIGIREWSCDDCGAVHDRDVNAAKNILRVGLDALAEGASSRGAVNLSPQPLSAELTERDAG